MKEKFDAANSVMDWFLQDRFVRNPKGKVPNHLLVTMREQWEKDMGAQLTWVRAGRSRYVTDRMLGTALEEDSSWSLEKASWWDPNNNMAVSCGS